MELTQIWVSSFAAFSFSGQVYTVCGSVFWLSAEFRLSFGRFEAGFRQICWWIPLFFYFFLEFSLNFGFRLSFGTLLAIYVSTKEEQSP